MWDSLWINCNLCTIHDVENDAGLGIIHNGAIASTAGNIVWVGEASKLPDAPEKLAKEINDLNGSWITPGLIDCHTHIVHGGERINEFNMRLEGASYEEIARAGGGIRSTVKATRAASEQELFDKAMKRAQSLQSEGVTVLEIKSGYGLDWENETKQLRVARQVGENLPLDVITTYLAAHTIPEEYQNDGDGYIDSIIEKLPDLEKSGLADAIDGFCEGIAFSPAQIEKLFKAAKDLGFSLKLHAEQLSDLGGAALAAKYGAKSADHLEYVSEKSAKAMAAANSVAVILPCAFYFLNETKKPPIDLFRENTVPMAVATDMNPGSSPCCSLLLAMNMACTFFKMTPTETMRGVTLHAAQALGLEKTHGSLEVGKVADLAIWDITHPAELSYHMGFNPLQELIKGGKQIIQR
ncbi:imidazolonepropionase [Kiloniella litopenaei]|uniref:Imidazolonepropionase n=1 Tax=Kiloniella litopenaei TaxID=1549748 RepID=A0A0M2R5X9_9PROT|nr:imidazolonepropionase [Kiloniella litopenaei]KKJ75395.1 imidazolonepropionase [Kiloniella litopenaei]